jgi:predicted nucleic acid-binding protein
VDTDVFVDHLRGSRRLAAGGDTYAYSVVTRCELFAGRGSDESTVRRLLQPFREITVDRSVAERAGRIRREMGIRTPDALIAAAALANRLTLLTRNVRDFEGVPGLKIRSPER